MSNEKNKINSLVGEPWEIPASVSWYGTYVAIGGRELSKRLEELYLSGVREVELILDVPGRRLGISGRIIYKRNKDRTYYYIYPKHPAQSLLRELYLKRRGNAEPYAKTPVPVVVVAIIPARES